MADDHNQRAYRGNDLAARGAGPDAGSGGSDPLAELARLIGQTNPFGEYGGANGASNGGRAAPEAPAPAAWEAEAPAYAAAPARNTYPAQSYSRDGYGRQAYGTGIAPADSQPLYPVDAHAPGYASQSYSPSQYPPSEYDQAFPPQQEPMHDVHQHFGPGPNDDYYDDVAPSRRRFSVLAIAGVLALAVVGTAGALGYRAVFGPSSAPANPPVIKADAAPSKVVPATSGNEQSKAITDRVGNNGPIERLLSREEQPVPVATTPNQPSAQPAVATNAAMGSGVVGEPRKIRTIPIRPDQAADAGPAAPPEPSPSQPPARVANAVPAAEPPPARVAPEPVRSAPPVVRNVAPPAAPQAAPHAAAPSNAPLSLNPNSQPARPARVATQTAAPAPQPAAAAGSGGYAVQVSAQRTEAEAQAAFQSLQGKYPSQLGSRAPVIKRVDLGDKGIYYRAMVVVGSNGEAGDLCTSLKAAGGSCIVQRN